MHLNLSRREFLKLSGAVFLPGLFSNCTFAGTDQRLVDRPNIVLITADDMNYDAVGAFGCRVDNITPNIDRLAAEGMRFEHGYVNIAVCQPSRQCIMTGRYPHRNGAQGFEPIDLNVPTLQELLKKAGYLNCILGKATHLAPKEKFCWDYYKDFGDLGKGRDPDLYYDNVKTFLKIAKNQAKPFFLMANSHDPHRPFAGSDQEKNAWRNDFPEIYRKIKPDDVTVPGHLPDLPQVRLEISEYYTSVYRCDQVVGKVMQALEEEGFKGNTLVMFLSDNGMALPFAKTNVYLNSTRTPWIANWPGRIKPGTVDREHFISGIDYMPTVIDVCGLDKVEGMDGFSFKPVLLGKKQAGREHVFTQFHETSAIRRFPMRCVQDNRFGYIFNFWSDGKNVFRNESQGGRTFNAMVRAGRSDPEIQKRVDLFKYRVLEEFYDFKQDPSSLNNLIDDPKYKDQVIRFRGLLEDYMKRTDDYAYQAFINRDEKSCIQQFMKDQDAEALERKEAKRIARQKQNRQKR